MINLANKGKSPIIFILALAIVLSSIFGISLPKQVEEELVSVKMKLEEGLEIITNKSYMVCDNVKWSEIKAAGVKMTETSMKGFLQICERLVLNLGNLQVYADLEARIMWVYSDPSKEEADMEVYYVQFA